MEEEALFSDPQNIPSVETLKDIELTIRRVSAKIVDFVDGSVGESLLTCRPVALKSPA